MTIEVGQPLTDVVQGLRRQGIEYTTGGLALSGGSEDIDYFSVDLDGKQMTGVVSYSKSKRTVVGLSLIVYPEGRPQKAYQVWLKARRITLNADGSFDVRIQPAGR